ncbi:MAG: PEP-CTERM sorting domain-containing protein, partial [Phycisphaeraceae bacterium]
TGRTEALMWIIPTPSTAALLALGALATSRRRR